MKKTLTITLLLLGSLTFAQAKKGHSSNCNKVTSTEFIEKYDTDGDGEISDEELAAAQEERAAAKAAAAEERAAAKEAREAQRTAIQELRDSYDIDADGELSDEELAAFLAALTEEYGEELAARYEAKGSKCNRSDSDDSDDSDELETVEL